MELLTQYMEELNKELLKEEDLQLRYINNPNKNANYIDGVAMGVALSRNKANDLFAEYQKNIDSTDYAHTELYSFWQERQWHPMIGKSISDADFPYIPKDKDSVNVIITTINALGEKEVEYTEYDDIDGFNTVNQVIAWKMDDIEPYEFEPNTTKEEMKKLKDGEWFVVNGERHRAVGDSHMSGDSTCDEYIVYDNHGNSWFENDFEDDKEQDYDDYE